MKSVIGFILLTLAMNVTAATLDAVTFADSVNVEGKELVLNGIGIRKATFLKIKVYYGALYLEQKSKDPSSFLANLAPKEIIMHFVRSVDAKKLKDAFIEGMEAANKNHAELKHELDQFNSHLMDMEKNDLIIITFTKTGVTLKVKDKPIEKIPGAEFSRALLNIWFTNPRDEDLRNGLLGQM